MDFFLPQGEREISFMEMLSNDQQDMHCFTSQMDEFSSYMDDFDRLPLFDCDIESFKTEPLFEPLDRENATTPTASSCYSSASSLEDDQGRVALETYVPSLSWSSMKDSSGEYDPNNYMVDPSLVLPNKFYNDNTSQNPVITNVFTATSSNTIQSPIKPMSPLLSSAPMSTTSQPTVFTVKTEAMEVQNGLPSPPVSANSLRTNGIQRHYNTNASPSPRQTNVSRTVPSRSMSNTSTQVSVSSNHTFRGKPVPPAPRRDERGMPKPAYSYSCLIALALKNSTTGSLPVSEIYAFMCEHFPYFRTAPNGWKNSVRHNLSLNKCFEKIEKPVAGNNQRKGCLWALNPAKIHKMDEEIQKWSKKDIQGIKDAMTNPEVLGALERGEMKFEGGASGSCPTSEDEDTDSEEMDTSEVPQNGLTTVKLITTAPQQKATISLAPRPHQPAILRHTNQAKLRSDTTSLPETLIEDLPSEDSSPIISLLPRTNTPITPRNVVLRKLPAISPVLRTTQLRTANYVYSPGQGAQSINRLLLANAKLG